MVSTFETVARLTRSEMRGGCGPWMVTGLALGCYPCMAETHSTASKSVQTASAERPDPFLYLRLAGNEEMDSKWSRG